MPLWRTGGLGHAAFQMGAPAYEQGFRGENGTRCGMVERNTSHDLNLMEPPQEGTQDRSGNVNSLADVVYLWVVDRVEPQLNALHVQVGIRCD